MKVSINKNLGAHSPFSEGSTIEEKAKIMRFKYPKACSSIETGAMAFATMVEDVKDAEAWKFIGFDTFEEFCQEELGRTINEVEDIVTGVKILGGNPTERQAKTASRSATAAKLVEAGTHTQSEAAREVGISQQAVNQATSKMTPQITLNPATPKQPSASCQKNCRSKWSASRSPSVPLVSRPASLLCRLHWRKHRRHTIS